MFERAYRDAGHHRAHFLNKLWIYYIYRDLCSWTPIFAHFMSHWTCEPPFSTKKVKIKKKGSVVPCILMCSIKQKKLNVLNDTGSRIPCNKNGWKSAFFPLVYPISRSNIMILSWKFYHNLFATGPTYAANFSLCRCS